MSRERRARPATASSGALAKKDSGPQHPKQRVTGDVSSLFAEGTGASNGMVFTSIARYRRGPRSVFMPGLSSATGGSHRSKSNARNSASVGMTERVLLQIGSCLSFGYDHPLGAGGPEAAGAATAGRAVRTGRRRWAMRRHFYLHFHRAGLSAGCAPVAGAAPGARRRVVVGAVRGGACRQHALPHRRGIHGLPRACYSPCARVGTIAPALCLRVVAVVEFESGFV